MPLLETFVGLLGLCVGSFLNVVIYRLPLGLSLTHPSRSFCPQCRSQLAWFDNIPLLSWLVLRGKCRACAAPISVQYPLVEAFTGLAFVLVFHLLFVGHARVGVALSPGPADGWLLLAWLAFVAVAIAFSAMDIVSYSIDIRLTDFAMVVALICYALWPLPNTYLATAQAPAAGAALAAGIASGVMLWLTVWRKPLSAHDLPASVETSDAPPDGDFGAAVAPASGVSRFGGLIGVFAALVLGCVLIAGGGEAGSSVRTVWPISAALALFFGGTVLAGAIPRASDHELASAIEEETPHARRAARGELLWLLPIILVGCGVWWLLHSNSAARSGWAAAAGWTPGYGLYPIGGIAFSMYGIVVAAAAGWLLRIVFTLAFGKEAFGTGDIYILAAAGAATGADIALLGLVFAVGLALLGWLLGVLLKSAAMIPFGPWLSIGFLLALWWNRPAVTRIDQYAGALAEAWNQRPDVVFVLGGVLLVGSVVAVGLAKLARRFTEPRSSGDHDATGGRS